MIHRKKNRSIQSESLFFKVIWLFCLGGIIFSCSPKAPLTMRLFMQTGGANVVLPDSPDGVSTVSEVTTLKDSLTGNKDQSQNDTTKKDIWKNVTLDQVTIVSQKKSIKRINESEGKFTLMFHVKVPKVLLDSCWKLTLYPVLIDQDSSVQLRPVILRGKEFIRTQEQQYKAYDDFLKGIIPAQKYDSAFINIDGITRDIYARQRLFWRVYQAERRNRLAYLKWKTLMDKRHGWINMRVDGNRNSLKQRMERGALEESVEKFVAGSDTVGIRNSYKKRYNHLTNFWPTYRFPSEMTVKDVPDRFQALYLSKGRIEDIHNYSLTPKDSVEIASHRYFQRAIAENEYNDKNRDLMRDRIIRFPYVDTAKVNLTADPSQDFSYLYMHQLPAHEGMKKMRITLRGSVLATDYSTWTIPPADTLTFVVASVADLIDTSLSDRFKIGGDSVANYSAEGKEYIKGVEALSNHEYHQALDILKKYSDYNTAVALTCLGYHAESDEILQKLPQTAAVYYLRAVVNARKLDYNTAVDCILRACQKDSRYLYRSNMDADIGLMISRCNGLKEAMEKVAL